MKWFEKEYKKRFEDESTMDGVETDALWDQISKSIPQEDTNKKTPYWRWTSIVLFFISMAFLWTFLQGENKKSDLPLSESNPSIHTSENSQSQDISGKEIIQYNEAENRKEKKSHLLKEDQNRFNNENAKSDDAIVERTQIVTSFDQGRSKKEIGKNLTSADNKDVSNESMKKTLLDESTIQNGSFQNNKQNQSANSNLTITSQPLSKKDITTSNEIIDGKSSKSIHSKAISNDPTVRDLLEFNSLDLLKIEDFDQKRSIDLPPVTPVKVDAVRKNPFAINVKTSVNFFDLKYSDDQNAELFAGKANDSLGSMQFGNGLAINLEYILNQSWSISAGFEFNNYENQLNTQLTSDTMVLDDMQKIRKAKNIRTVRHHNKLSTFSIPLSIAYEKQLSDRWNVGASLGVSYALIRSQNGRLLGRNNVILDYSDKENIQFKNFLSFRINPFIRFGVNDKVSLTLNAGLSLQNHGKSEVQDLNQSSMIYNMGMGVYYKM